MSHSVGSEHRRRQDPGPNGTLVVVTEHYAEAVFSERGQCWRFVTKPGEGQPIHCPAAVTHKGRFKLRGGRWVAVWSCEGHLLGVIEPEAWAGP